MVFQFGFFCYQGGYFESVGVIYVFVGVFNYINEVVNIVVGVVIGGKLFYGFLYVDILVGCQFCYFIYCGIIDFLFREIDDLL